MIELPINYLSREHEDECLKLAQKMSDSEKPDCYYMALAYLFTLDSECKKHINDLFDFKEYCIKPDTALSCAWQTGTSLKTTRLAYNLFNGYTGQADTDDNARYYTPEYLFCCPYAKYYYEAIRIRYNEYC